MPFRRSANISLIVVLVLLVLAPAAAAGGGGDTNAARGAELPSAMDPRGTGDPMVPPGGHEPSSPDVEAQPRGTIEVTASPKSAAATATIAVTTTAPDPVAGRQNGNSAGNHEQAGQGRDTIEATVSPTRAAATATIAVTTTAPDPVAGRQNGNSAGNHEQAGQARGSVIQPASTATPHATAAQGTTAGGDGDRAMDSGNATLHTGRNPVPAATTVSPAPVRTLKDGPVTTPPSNPGAARATSPGNPGSAPTTGPADGQGPSAAIRAPSAASTGALIATCTPARDPDTGTHGAPDGTAAVPRGTDNDRHGPANMSPAVGNRSGVRENPEDRSVSGVAGAGLRAGQTRTLPTLTSFPADGRAIRSSAAADGTRGGRTGGFGQHAGRGTPRPQNAGKERGPPDTPAAAPVRTGLEPVDRAKDDSGRGRRSVPAVPHPIEGEDAAPDPLLFLRFLFFLGYRRLKPSTLLDNPVRRGLAAAIATDPGLDLAGCVAATGANRETLRYHIALLVYGGRIVEETRNGSVRYFPRDPALSSVHRAVIHLDRNPSLAPVLRHIHDHPGIARRELARLLGVAGPTVTRQVHRLVDEGLVENRGSGSSQGYWLTPACADTVASIVMAHAERNREQRVTGAVTT